MKRGQTLVILLVFITVSIIIASAAATLNIVNSTAVSKVEIAESAYNIAESGLENALLRLLRDTSYPGETLTVDAGTATITVTGTNPYTVTSRGEIEGFIRVIQAVVTFSTGVMTINSWQEI